MHSCVVQSHQPRERREPPGVQRTTLVVLVRGRATARHATRGARCPTRGARRRAVTGTVLPHAVSPRGTHGIRRIIEYITLYFFSSKAHVSWLFRSFHRPT